MAGAFAWGWAGTLVDYVHMCLASCRMGSRHAQCLARSLCCRTNAALRLMGLLRVRGQRDRCIVHSPSLPAQHDACVSNGVYLCGSVLLQVCSVPIVCCAQIICLCEHLCAIVCS